MDETAGNLRSPEDAEGVFLSNLELIGRTAASICHRNSVFGDDVDEFESWARIRLIENDYRRIRRFKGDSALSVYLNVVLQNLFRDWRDSRWGKWRPSAKARRLGTTAVQLETLIHRDRLHESEAIETVLTMSRAVESRDELEALVLRLPHRTPGRRFEGHEVLDSHGSGPTPEDLVQQQETHSIAEAVNRAIREGISSLSDEDRVILRLRFLEGLKIVDIARLLGLEQAPLYRRLQRIFRSLRHELEARRVDWSEIDELFDLEDHGLRLDIVESENAESTREASNGGSAAEIAGNGPSRQVMGRRSP